MDLWHPGMPVGILDNADGSGPPRLKRKDEMSHPLIFGDGDKVSATYQSESVQVVLAELKAKLALFSHTFDKHSTVPLTIPSGPRGEAPLRPHNLATLAVTGREHYNTVRVLGYRQLGGRLGTIQSWLRLLGHDKQAVGGMDKQAALRLWRKVFFQSKDVMAAVRMVGLENLALLERLDAMERFAQLPAAAQQEALEVQVEDFNQRLEAALNPAARRPEGPQQTVVFDMSFAGEEPHDVGMQYSSLLRQIQRATEANARHPQPFRILLTSFKGPLKEYCMERGFLQEMCDTTEQPIEQVFKQGELVFLTPDASEDVEDIEPNKTYVIGGIIDRFDLKTNMSLHKASSIGVQAKKLPLHKYLLTENYGPARKLFDVLRVDQAFSALLWRRHEEDWPAAFEKTFPKRFEMRAVRRMQRGAGAKPLASKAKQVLKDKGSEALAVFDE